MQAFLFAYGFEAKSIQSYILDRTRMREMVGASSLVDALTSTLLPHVLDAQMQWPMTQYQLCRCGAGGVSILLRDLAQAERLQQLFSVLLPQFAPGLRFVQAVAQGDSSHASLQALHLALQTQAQAPHLMLAPPARPFTQRAPRSSRAACAWRNDEWLDQENLRKEQFLSGPAATHSSSTPILLRDRLAQKFLADSLPAVDRSYAWPVELNPEASADSFPFLQDDSYLAIVHIDGNGLGLVLQTLRDAIALRDDYAELECAFSGLIEEVCLAAAQQACTQTLLPVARETAMFPARPLVLGGDDVTMILRADVALSFVQAFLLAFETHSASKLRDFAARYVLPDNALPTCLTACAGLVYVRAKFPFYLAYQACEQLCGRAKQASKNAKLATDTVAPSVLVFERMTDRQQDQYSQAQAVRLLGNAYALHRGQTLPALEDLLALCALAQSGKIGGKGALFEVHALLSVPQDSSWSLARQRYARWRDVTIGRSKEAFEEFERCLLALGDVELVWSRLPLLRLRGAAATQDGAQFAVLGDVLVLQTVQGGRKV